MRRSMTRVTTLLVLASVSSLLIGETALPASAHEQRKVGKYKFTVGWGEEPLYAGFKNSVQFILDDANGKPVADLGDTLKVTVIAGTENVTLALAPTFDPDTGLGTPGDYRAWFIPTLPGNYTFHFTGAIKGQKVDQKFTSSETTFDAVKDPNDAQFPVKAPTATQLSDRIDRESLRLASADTKNKNVASTARLLAIIGLVVGVLGLGTGVLKGRKKPA